MITLYEFVQSPLDYGPPPPYLQQRKKFNSAVPIVGLGVGIPTFYVAGGGDYLKNKLGPKIEEIKTKISEVPQNISDKFSGLKDKASDALSDTAKTASEAASNIAQNASDSVSNAAKTIGDKVTQNAQGIKDAVLDQSKIHNMPGLTFRAALSGPANILSTAANLTNEYVANPTICKINRWLGTSIPQFKTDNDLNAFIASNNIGSSPSNVAEYAYYNGVSGLSNLLSLFGLGKGISVAGRAAGSTALNAAKNLPTGAKVVGVGGAIGGGAAAALDSPSPEQLPTNDYTSGSFGHP